MPLVRWNYSGSRGLEPSRFLNYQWQERPVRALVSLLTGLQVSFQRER